MRLFAALLVVVSFASCAEVYFRHSGTHRYAAYPATCHVRLVATEPGEEYEEIGILSVDGDERAFRDPGLFLQEAREEVCRAGGEVVVTQVNGYGSIVRGVVFRRTARVVEAEKEEGDGCDPICSPGFACNEAKCVPVCNPACAADEACGRDRLCHPRAAGAGE